MKNYDHAYLEDLLIQDSFCQWVLDQANETNTAFWESWLNDDIGHQAILDQAKTVLETFKHQDALLSAVEIEVETARILQSVRPPKVVPLIPNWFKLAASIALLVAAGLWFFNEKGTISTPSVSESLSVQMIDIQRVGTDTTIQFSDGSTVQLKQGGSIQFDKNFIGKERVVTLVAGEAFFDVTKNPEKPFIVFANDIVTRVLGTSFTVRTSNTEGATSSVVVRTGRVAVFKKADFAKPNTPVAVDTQKCIFLTPNQQVNTKENTVSLVASVVEKPILLESPAKNPDFKFDDAPIADVLKILEVAYGVQIVADNAILKSCRLTISLGKDDLFVKLKVICKVIGAKYEVANTKVILTGKGCY